MDYKEKYNNILETYINDIEDNKKIMSWNNDMSNIAIELKRIANLLALKIEMEVDKNNEY